MEELSENEPYKFGIQFEPPSLVYVYRNKSSRKLTRCMMPVRNFSLESDYKVVAQNLKYRHEDKLNPIEIEKVEAALQLLINHMQGKNTKDSRNRRLHHIRQRVKVPNEDSFIHNLEKLKISGEQSLH